MNSDDKWLTRKHAASVAGVATRTIDRAVKAGRIRAHRVHAREVWVWADDVHALRALPRAPVNSCLHLTTTKN